MSRMIAFALAASVLALPASAAERKFDPEACAKAVAPYLDDSTFAVLHVDLTAVDVDALAAKAADVGQGGRRRAADSAKGGHRRAEEADRRWRPRFVCRLQPSGRARTVAVRGDSPGEGRQGRGSRRGDGAVAVLHPQNSGRVGAGRIGDGLVFADEQATFQRLRTLKPDA